MTKQEIIEIIERAFERELHWEEKATDELFELIEQEKKEQVREILRDVTGKVELKYGYESLIYLRICGIIDGLCQEYGVEL